MTGDLGNNDPNDIFKKQRKTRNGRVKKHYPDPKSFKFLMTPAQQSLATEITPRQQIKKHAPNGIARPQSSHNGFHNNQEKYFSSKSPERKRFEEGSNRYMHGRKASQSSAMKEFKSMSGSHMEVKKKVNDKKCVEDLEAEQKSA